MLTVKELTASFLYEKVNNLLDVIQKAGVDVVAIINYGNKINQKNT